jgi:vacuolar-type H+-ATPase subunit B/Vma2
MPTQTRTKTKATPQELVELKNLLPVLARLIETGKISIRLGPVADVKDWLNNYQAFEKTPTVTIDAVSVRLVGTELQIDCGLDDYAA